MPETLSHAWCQQGGLEWHQHQGPATCLSLHPPSALPCGSGRAPQPAALGSVIPPVRILAGCAAVAHRKTGAALELHGVAATLCCAHPGRWLRHSNSRQGLGRCGGRQALDCGGCCGGCWGGWSCLGRQLIRLAWPTFITAPAASQATHTDHGLGPVQQPSQGT